MRSETKQIDEGENPSHYFCNLENRHFTNKVIPIIEKNDREIIVDQFEILSNVEKLYNNFYSNNSEKSIDDYCCKIDNYKFSKLSNEQSDRLKI